MQFSFSFTPFGSRAPSKPNSNTLLKNIILERLENFTEKWNRKAKLLDKKQHYEAEH